MRFMAVHGFIIVHIPSSNGHFCKFFREILGLQNRFLNLGEMRESFIFSVLALQMNLWHLSSIIMPRTNFVRYGSNLHAMPIVPYYPNKGSRDYQWMDIYNALGRDRTLFVGRFLDEENCNQLIASLIWLQGSVCFLVCLKSNLNTFL